MYTRSMILIFCIMAPLSCAHQVRSDSADAPTVLSLEDAEVTARCDEDYRAILRYHEGIESVSSFIKSRNDIFGRPKNLQDKVFNTEERDAILHTWRSFLDYYMALESIRQFHSKHHIIEDMKRKYPSFRCYYASYVTQYRYALDFLYAADRDKGLSFVLNEPLPEVGLDRNSYGKFKYRYLNVLTASEFAALDFWYRDYRRRNFERVHRSIEGDSRAIWRFGRGKGIVMTLQNALTIAKDATKRFFFPIQSGIAEWAGDTKIWRLKKSLVTPDQLAGLLPKMQPGDIMLERREWYISNVGLPGYWPHAALYIGTAGERRAYFADDAVSAWVKDQGEPGGDLDTLLEKRYPGAYGAFTAIPEEGHPHRVIEAMSEGVLFTTFEHSGMCDSLAVLRPHVSKLERARGIYRAFAYYGRPYDFKFDFRTDAAIVCTELVYKCYEPAINFGGIQFMLKTIMGKRVMPANEIARQHDLFLGTPLHQTDFVAFLDGYEKRGYAVSSTADEFRKSWKRPKWHIMIQKEIDGDTDISRGGGIVNEESMYMNAGR